MRATQIPSPTRGTPRLLGAAALLFGAGLGLLPASAFAAAFVNSDQSPAGVGLAGAMVARPDDASAIYYNPAGLGFQSGLSVLAGMSLLSLHQSVTDPSGTVYNSQGGNFVLPTIFAAARVSDRISLGLGAYVNHALTADWQSSDPTQLFPGRYKALRVSIQSLTFNPTIAIRPIPELSIGAGIDVELGSLDLVRSLAFGSADGRIEVAGSAVAVGGNIGALLRLLDGRLNIGLAYRSAINFHFSGMQLGTTAPAGVSLVFPYNQAATDLQTPHSISVGAAGKPVRWLTISADFISTLWGDVHNQTLTLSDGAAATQVSVSPRDWKDSYSGRLGLEADLATLLPTASKLWPKLRLGFGYDQSPVPATTIDTATPDGDRLFPTVGVSLGYRGLGSIELGYAALIFRSRTAQNPDLPLSYDSMVHVFSAALNLQLDWLFGRRSTGFAGRQLDPAPLPPPGEEPTMQGSDPATSSTPSAS
jgi:long-chain fatty acid transport protein